jgi:nitroreductase
LDDVPRGRIASSFCVSAGEIGFSKGFGKALDDGWDTLIMGIRDTAKVKTILGIPAGETLMSVIAVGKAAVKPIKPPRKPVADVLKTA